MSSVISDNALGYFYNQGGLNNQKLALFGLLHKARQEKSGRVVLPNLLLFDQVTFNHVPVPLDNFLQIAALRDFAARYGIEILDIPPRGDEGAWDYFHHGNNYIPCAALLNELTADSFICDFLRSLVPTIQSSFLLRRVADATYGEKGIHLAAQLRVERDWPDHTVRRLKPTVGGAEDNAPSFREIIAKICGTLPDDAGIYVVCDEAALPVPKDEIRNEVKHEFGTDLFWKSDFLTTDELAGLSLLDQSMLDFEMCIAAESFVGLSRSTFSNMVALEKYARTRMPVERHYVYNIIGPQLALRKDNGAFSVPELAAAADPWNPAYGFHVAQIFQSSGEQERALERYSAYAASTEAAPEDAYISLYRAAQIKAELGFPPGDVIGTYLRAAELLPSRAEARHGGSRHARLNNMYEEGYRIAKPAVNLPAPEDGRFVEPWIYEWALLDEYTVNAYWAEHYHESLNGCLQILARSTLPENHRSRIVANARYAFEALPRQEPHLVRLVPKVSAAMPTVRATSLPRRHSDKAKLPEVGAHSEVYSRFLREIEDNSVDDGLAARHWRQRCQQIKEDARAGNQFEFLRWPSLVDFSAPESYVPQVCYDELRRSHEWARRWFRLTRESKLGSPRDFSKDFGTSPILVHHAYHLLRYETVTGRSLLDCDVIFEFGGGYGSFCRLLRDSGFSGLHVIYDLPHISSVQRLWLTLSGFTEVPCEEMPKRGSHGFCLITDDLLDRQFSLLQSHENNVGFVATWSLSEAPITVRERIFPRFHQICNQYLIAYQPAWENINNEEYFMTFKRCRPELDWKTEGLPPSTYLFV